MRFEFTTANRILFGAGTLREVGPIAAGSGRRALIVNGKQGERVAPLLAILAEHQIESIPFSVAGEPTVSLVVQGVETARQTACDLIVGIGGGSVLDAAKAIAILLTNSGNPYDYLEVIGRGKPLTQPAAPCIAVPTTAGTGAEVTRNAVLLSPQHRVKVSLRSPLMLPRVAIVDPEMTYSLPPSVTASTGMDALTQLIEPFVSIRANPLTDALCREGISRAARALRRAFEQGNDCAAREDLSLASLFSGLALANAGLGAVHGIASVLGGMYPAAHGAICARLLSPVMAVNLHAMQRHADTHPAWSRYVEVAQILTGSEKASPAQGVAWVQELCQELKIPPLREYSVSRADFPEIIEKSLAASSTKANPVRLTADEMQEILELAWS